MTTRLEGLFKYFYVDTTTSAQQIVTIMLFLFALF